MIKLKAIDHINMNVKNLDESISFYGEFFGMKVKEEGVYNGAPWAIVGIPGSVYLCMYERDPVDPDNSNGINHFGFHLEDFWQAKEQIENSPIKINYLVEQGKSHSLYIIDPSGYEIELSEKFGGDLN